MKRRIFSSAIGLMLLLCSSGPASALDKQGSAHGGELGGEGEGGVNFSGSLLYGSSIINGSYASRPDNTGLVLFRYAAHGDLDLIGRKLSIPLDLNMFTDRQKKGAGVFVPSELDLIGGVTTTHMLTRATDIELGARMEHDRPVDRSGITQSYADVRARLLYSLAKVWPGLKRDLNNGDILGNATLGWFAFNPTFPSRPDNTGRALLRYVLHAELSVWSDHLSVGIDGNIFTDRRANVVIQPSELDVTYDVILRQTPFELHIAYERDMPLDRRSLVQSFVYVNAVWSFDLRRVKATQPTTSLR